MTAADLKRLSSADLHALYSRLRADRLPVGTFDGSSWPLSTYGLWRGKVFEHPCYACQCPHTVVRNRLGPWRLIRGDVSLDYVEVLIDYPSLHLQDRLKPVSDRLWLGFMDLGKLGTVWFSLEAVT